MHCPKGGNIIYKLDRIYDNKDFFNFVSNTLSDHHPIKDELVLCQCRPKEARKSTSFILNASLLKDEHCKEVISSLRENNKRMLKEESAIECWNTTFKS